MDSNKREELKLKYAANALKGNSEEMARAMVNQWPLLHSSACALLNYARLYLWETDFDAMAAIFPLPPKFSRRAFLGWTFIRYVDGLVDKNTDLQQQISLIEWYYQILRKQNLNKAKDVFEKMTEVYVILEDICKPKTINDVLGIFHSFDIDIRRKGQIPNWHQYHELIYYKAECVGLFWLRLHLNRNDELLTTIAHHFGRIGQYIDDVCDYYKDLDVGQYNITLEELQELGIQSPFEINRELIRQFCQHRCSLILMHCQKVLEVIKKLNSNKDKRIILRWMEIATQLIQLNQLWPGAKHHFPYEPFIKWITNVQDPMKYEQLYYRLGSLFTHIPIGKIPIS